MASVTDVIWISIKLSHILGHILYTVCNEYNMSSKYKVFPNTVYSTTMEYVCGQTKLSCSVCEVTSSHSFVKTKKGKTRLRAEAIPTIFVHRPVVKKRRAPAPRFTPGPVSTKPIAHDHSCRSQLTVGIKVGTYVCWGEVPPEGPYSFWTHTQGAHTEHTHKEHTRRTHTHKHGITSKAKVLCKR